MVWVISEGLIILEGLFFNLKVLFFMFVLSRVLYLNAANYGRNQRRVDK